MLRKLEAKLDLAFCCLFLLSLPLWGAEPPKAEWQNTAGLEWDDSANRICPMEDGGYIVVGYAEPTGADKNVYLVKVNAAGDIEWERTFGGDKDDEGYDVCQTSDGGYFVVGTTRSWSAGNQDLYLIKIDSTGKELWHRFFGGKSNDGPAEFGALLATPDGGYLVAGWTWSYGEANDIWLVKLNSFGNMVWQKTIGGKKVEWARSIIRCHDSNYLIVGKTTTYGAGKGDVYVVKVSADGEIVWEKTYGGRGLDWANSVLETPDGGYIVVGGTRSFGNGEDDTYVIKLNANGDKLWERVFMESEGADHGVRIICAQSGGFLIALTLQRCCTGWDAELLRIGAEGNVMWKILLGGNSDDGLWDLQQTSDGGYIGAGTTGSYGAGGEDAYLVKLGPEP